jgi:hypothetical protein
MLRLFDDDSPLIDHQELIRKRRQEQEASLAAADADYESSMGDPEQGALSEDNEGGRVPLVEGTAAS